MKDIEHASINGIEVHNLLEPEEGDILYAGDLFMDGREIGKFTEDTEGAQSIEISSDEDASEFNERVNTYITALSDTGHEEDAEIEPSFFLEDLIELEMYLGAFKEGVAEGYGCLLVNYKEEGVDVYSVESEESVEDIARENNLADFQTFYAPEHFIIKC